MLKGENGERKNGKQRTENREQGSEEKRTLKTGTEK
jgi:hypothetical protein